MNQSSRIARYSESPIILAHLTLLHLSPPELLRTAESAGYDGVTLRLAPAHPSAGEVPYPMVGHDKPMMREVLARLRGGELSVHEIEVVRITEDLDVPSLEPLMEAGAALGAKSLLTYAVDDDDLRVAAKLAAIAEMAKKYQLRPALEFMVYNGVKTIQQASRIVELARDEDIILMVDALHLDRSGGRISDVQGINRRRMPYLQLCDAPRQPLAEEFGGVRIEARQHRLLPGDGDLDLEALIACFAPGTPISIEAPVKKLIDSIPALAIAKSALVGTKKILQRLDARQTK